MTRTNIKGLPEGKYWTEYGYSQSYPWVEVKRTAKTVTLKRIWTKPDPEWKEKAVFHVGGFAAHCANQEEQTWLYDGVGYETVTIRQVKSRYCGEDTMWGRKGVKFAEDVARYHYDYNF